MIWALAAADGYLFGQYRRLKGTFENGVLTGKASGYGGSLTRPEATGYGAMYYLQEVSSMRAKRSGARLLPTGFGNVTWGICKKALHLGAKVVALSGPDGYIYDEEGVSSSEEKVNYLLEMRAPPAATAYGRFLRQVRCPVLPRREAVGRQGRRDHAVCHARRRQHGVCPEDRRQRRDIHRSRQHAPTNDALYYLMSQKNMVVAPSRTTNAGGVGVSALEMSQNSERLVWTAEEVDAQLHR